MYADFVLKQKKERNLFQVKFSREKKNDAPLNRNIDLDTISDYLFELLRINPEDLMEVDLNTGRWDVKNLLFKPEETDKYVNDFPQIYLDFLVSVSRVTVTETKVSFRNIPSYIPDIEILNLCSLYGTV